MKQQPLSASEKEVIITLHREGKTVPEIVTVLRRHNSTVYEFLKTNNLTLNRKPDWFSEQQKEQIKELYLSGMSLKKIADQFNCSRETVRNRLVKMGVEIRPQNKKIILPDHITNKIVDEYQYERCSIYELAKRYNLSTTKITSILRDKNIVISPIGKRYEEEAVDEAEKLTKLGLHGREIAQKLGVSEAWISHKFKERGIERSRGPKPKIRNINYFDTIDSEDKAYFLGLLVAEGNLGEKKNKITLGLQSEDADAVLGFTMYIGSDGRNKYLDKREKHPQWKKVYTTQLHSKHMYQSLLRLGLKPRKSGEEVMPDIPKHLIPHFIRSYFDGDGITCIGPSRKYSGFVGGKELLESIQEHLGTNLPIHQRDNTYVFTGGISFSRMLYDYMYSDATIWLDRKRRRMDTICGYSSDKWPDNKIIPDKYK